MPLLLHVEEAWEAYRGPNTKNGTKREREREREKKGGRQRERARENINPRLQLSRTSPLKTIVASLS